MALVFPILTQFDDRAAKKADKTFGALGKKFAALFSVGAVVKFGKESVKAFQEAEREAALLRSQLEAINLGFASPLINDYIDNLELLSGVSGGDLTNAFLSLSQATNDVTTAQELLNVALDISAATGKNLNSVSVALQRAYKGELTSLTRLRIGFTTAELKGKKFDEVLGQLRDKFTGASARAADTYAGKIARLRGAVEQAQEAFGEGLVSGLEDSGRSIEDLQKQIIAFGESLGELSAEISNFANDTVDAFTKIRDSAPVEAVLNTFEALTRGVGFIVTGELIPTFDAQSARLAGEERRKNEVANKTILRSRNVLARTEARISRERKNQLTNSEKEKKNQEKLSKAKAMFDMEQIQIQAALQGKITEEERIRLQLMQAIVQENGKEAERLAEELKKAQEETAKLAKSLTDLKAGNPFAQWDQYTTYALGLVGQMRAALDDVYRRANDFLKIEKGVGAGSIGGATGGITGGATGGTSGSAGAAADAAAAAAAAAKAAADAADAQRKAYEEAEKKAKEDASLIEAAAAAAKAAADALAAAERAAAEAAAAQAAAKTAAEKEAADAQAAAAKGAFDAAKVEEEAAKDLADAAADELGAAASDAAAKIAADAINAIIESSGVMGRVAGESGAIGAAGITNIIVNVAGSVISQEDLTQTITDSQADYQRSGGGISVYDSKVI